MGFGGLVWIDGPRGAWWLWGLWRLGRLRLLGRGFSRLRWFGIVGRFGIVGWFGVVGWFGRLSWFIWTVSGFWLDDGDNLGDLFDRFFGIAADVWLADLDDGSGGGPSGWLDNDWLW